MAGVKVADTFIAVGADMSGYRKSLRETGLSEAKRLASEIKDALRRPDPVMFGGRSIAGNLIADLRSGIKVTDALKTAARGLGSTFKNVTASALQSSLNGVKNVLGGIRSALGSVAQGFGLGAGIVSFQALGRAISDVVGFIPGLIDKARDYALTVRTIQISTGATVEESSRFAATLDYLGGRTTKLSNLFAQMSRNLDTATPQLNALGVTTHKVNGAVLSQIEILENARHAFQRFGDGTAKADAIARAFGEEGLATFVEYLRLTDEQIRIIAEDAEASGQIISAAQIKAALVTERESNRIEMALRGIGIALLTTVGPQISSFLSNLTGWIQENMDAISQAIGKAVSYILGLVGALVGATGGMDSFSSKLFGASKAVSPYSADLASLRSQLTALGEKNVNAADTTDALRDSIRDQIKAVERQIEVLKRQEAAEDTVFKRTMRNLAQVYQARLDNLELAERERENLMRQRDLNDQLNEAQIDLIEAQRGKVVKGGKIEVDADDVADAMARVADIQNEQAEAARSALIDNQREGLAATRDYIESIGELLENAENKKAALNTLRRREDVLEARRAAQLAAGDPEGAAETAARIEAIKTAEVRAEEQIRNEARQTALDRQKDMLQEELSAVRSVATSSTNVRRAEITKQIRDLEAQQVAWEKSHQGQQENLNELITRLKGEGGLTPALEEARLAGVKFGEDVKTALGNLAGLFGSVAGFLGDILEGLDAIGKSDVWKFLTNPIKIEGIEEFNALIEKLRNPRFFEPEGGGSGAGGGFGGEGGFFKGGRIPGPVGERQPVFAHGGEYVIDNSLSTKLERALSPQSPALIPLPAGGVGIGHGHDIYMDGDKVAQATQPRIERSLADKRRL